jgi:hypothetical protein
LSAVVAVPTGDFVVHLRATAKVLRSLTLSTPTEAASSTALGDWYVTRVVIDRIPILVLVSSGSILPILVRARDVRSLPETLPAIVRARLHRLGVPKAIIDAEVDAMDPVHVSKTADRSVLGILVDFGKLLRHILPDVWNEGDFVDIEARLAETPCFVGRRSGETIFPDRDTPLILQERWGSGSV